MYLGVARAKVGPAAAVIDADRGLIAACEENRISRARYAPVAGPPALALAELLTFLNRASSDISAVGLVEDEDRSPSEERGLSAISIDGHQAHAV
ncbi:MAG: hypothetical protein ACRD1H_01820, partial [Vicinamibacterales bacterium]